MCEQETHGPFYSSMAEATDVVQKYQKYKGLSTTILFSAVRGIHVYNLIPHKGEYIFFQTVTTAVLKCKTKQMTGKISIQQSGMFQELAFNSSEMKTLSLSIP